MRKTIILALAILGFYTVGYALRVNPGSQATGDSANVGTTLVYRDASGDFAAGVITVNTLTVATGITLTMPAAETVGAAGTITADACGGIKRITSTAARTTNTTDTFTAPAAGNAGCLMDIINVGGFAITLDYNANFHAAGAADVVLGSSDTVRVGSTGASGFWYQIGGTGAN